MSGEEPESFRRELARLGGELERHRREIEPLLSRATRPHPEVLLLVAAEQFSSPDTKFLLRQLEKRARVAIVCGGSWSTAGTFDDEALDLSELPGFMGLAGYAWGQVAPEGFLPALVRLLDGV